MAQTVQSRENIKSDSLREEVKERAAEVQQQAQQTVKEVKDQAQQQTKTMMATGKSQTAGQLSSVAEALRTTSRELRHQDNETIAHYSEMAAEKAEEFSTYLAEKNIDELLFDFENFARRKPEIFLGAAFMGGLLLGRFIKSSNSRDYNGDEDYRSSDYSAESRPYPIRHASDHYSEVSRPVSQSEYGTPGTYPERRYDG